VVLPVSNLTNLLALPPPAVRLRRVRAGGGGLTIGSGLTWSGSLANLLWAPGADRQGLTPSSRDVHRVSLLLTPVSLVAGVLTLSLLADHPAAAHAA